MADIWTFQTCGDGVCDVPFEYPAFSRLGCQIDCGLAPELFDTLVVLTGDFAKTELGAGGAVDLQSSVSWNLCWSQEARREAGLEDECWFAEPQTLPSTLVAETHKFALPPGQWYVELQGDYYRVVQGRVFDARNTSLGLRELGVSPAWDSCEVRPGWGSARASET